MKLIERYSSFSLLASVFIMLAFLTMSTEVKAQRIPLACQTEEVGGLHWQSGRWVLSKFQQLKFVLVQDGETLTADSAAKALGGSRSTCKVSVGIISCDDPSGGFLYFSLKTKAGTVAQLMGAVSGSTSTPDSLTVAPFVCQAF